MSAKTRVTVMILSLVFAAGTAAGQESSPDDVSSALNREILRLLTLRNDVCWAAETSVYVDAKQDPEFAEVIRSAKQAAGARRIEIAYEALTDLKHVSLPGQSDPNYAVHCDPGRLSREFGLDVESIPVFIRGPKGEYKESKMRARDFLRKAAATLVDEDLAGEKAQRLMSEINDFETKVRRCIALVREYAETPLIEETAIARALEAYEKKAVPGCSETAASVYGFLHAMDQERAISEELDRRIADLESKGIMDWSWESVKSLAIDSAKTAL